MAGMVPKYTAQLVILETQDNGDLVAALEALMKADGSAVSRADVLRQALAPGLTRLRKRYEDEGLGEALATVREVREGKEAIRTEAARVRESAVHA
jgi:hypothetical protein